MAFLSNDCEEIMVVLSDVGVTVKPLEHLGLIAAVIDKLGLIEKIDRRLKVSKNKGAKVSMGQRVKAMILNGLGFIDDRLYMFPNFLANKPVERLFGDNLSAKDFNDDALGRALDEIYAYGVTKLFSEVAFEIGTENGLLGKSVHFDTTSLSVYGDYDDIKNSIESSDKVVNGKKPIEITYGYSKDHRQDLKQMVINLATTGASGFPIWMEAHSGNASDKVIIQEATARMRAFCGQLKAAPAFLYVGDGAMYENCVKKAGDLKWLSRVPENIKKARTLLDKDDHEFTWDDIGNGYKMTLTTSSYGNVEQRWALIFSEHAFAREIKTLEKRIEREKEKFEKELWHLSNQPFACEKDARKVGTKLIKTLKYHAVEWTINTTRKHNGKGRPKKTDLEIKTEYHINGKLSQDIIAIEIAKRSKGRFILATNELDTKKLSDLAILTEYKEQSKTESGFRFIKGNAMEVSSVFLKKPSRIEALTMVMTLCLMIYSFAQYHLRKSLEIANETIPDQLNKPTQKPTMAWICRMFYGIGVALLRLGTETRELISNLTDITKRIVHYFGAYAEKIYGLC